MNHTVNTAAPSGTVAPAGAPPVRASARLTFLDGLRGFAILLMILNHTLRDWMDVGMGWTRYYLIYGTLIVGAALFLFLVGFCLPISYHRAPDQPGSRSLLKHLRRGAMLIGAGFLLNALVTPEDPLLSGGMLQTIGIAIILLGPVVPWLPRRSVRWTLLGLAAVSYLTFAGAFPALTRWSGAHPVMAKVFFNDFPPWPWLAVAMIGLVLGWTWLEARARGVDQEIRFFTSVVAWSLVLVLAYLVWEWWSPSTSKPRFGFPRDFILNHHWTPRGTTTFLTLGGVGGLLAGMYWLMERRRFALPWLVTLGQAALMLYFVHQLIELSLLRHVLDLRFNNWLVYGVVTVLFTVLLWCVGRAWVALRPRVKALMFRPLSRLLGTGPARAGAD
jgi:uncharacterized membrane protein